MLNIKGNKKGFTLIEVIIAMSIFTIIIGIGYTALNKMNLATKDQQNISTEQLNANLINKYLVKDLENATKFEKESDTKFKLNDGSIIYEVSTTNQNGKDFYNLTRKEGSNNIELISKQPKLTNKPFFIESKNGSKDIYTVSMDSNSNSNKKYTFDVTPRLLAISELFRPEDTFSEHNKVTFWANQTEDNKINIGYSTNGKHGFIENDKDITSNSAKFDIKAIIRPTDSGSGDVLDIGTGLKGESLSDNKIQTNKIASGTDKIIINVAEGVKLKINVSWSSTGNTDGEYTTIFDNTAESEPYIEKMKEIYLSKEVTTSFKNLKIEGSFEKPINSDSSIDIIYGKSL